MNMICRNAPLKLQGLACYKATSRIPDTQTGAFVMWFPAYNGPIEFTFLCPYMGGVEAATIHYVALRTVKLPARRLEALQLHPGHAGLVCRRCAAAPGLA